MPSAEISYCLLPIASGVDLRLSHLLAAHKTYLAKRHHPLGFPTLPPKLLFA